MCAGVLIGSDVITGSGGMSTLYAKDGALTCVAFGPAPAPGVCSPFHDTDARPSYHVQVKPEGATVQVSAAVGEVVWDRTARCWTMTRQCKASSPPPRPVDHSVGKYSPTKLLNSSVPTLSHPIMQ